MAKDKNLLLTEAQLYKTYYVLECTDSDHFTGVPSDERWTSS